MTTFEDYISKRTIRYWLENYESLVVQDRPVDATPVHSSPKEVDGISAPFMNRVMLEQAVDRLPKKVQICVKNRWYYRHAVQHTCNVLQISSDEYYKYCNEGVDLIHEELNGSMVGVQQLLNKIKNI